MVLRFLTSFLLMIVCQAKESECRVILDILSIYEKGSGQKINRDKTNIFFSVNILPNLQSSIQMLFGVPSIRQYEKYLDLPAFVGRAKKKCFVYIKEQIWKNFFLGLVERSL